MSWTIRILISFIIMASLGYAIWSLQYASTDQEDNHADSHHRGANLSRTENERMKEDIVEKKTDNASKVERKYERNAFQAGMNLLVYGHPDLSEARSTLKHLNKLGVNSVAIAFPFYQKDWQASKVSASSEMTPAISELESLITLAHAEELSVMLRPMLDEQSFMASGHWRGQIQPANPAEWFESYRMLLRTYAELAETHHVDVLNIGTELNSLQHRYSEEWIKLIEDLRTVYNGDLIYSFNWDTVQEISSIEFVPLLDHIGIDAYFPLKAQDGASTETLEQAWKQWTDKWNSLPEQPSIIITEAGMIPVEGAHRQPYAWRIPDGKLDWQAQADYYEATFNALHPITQGIYWWAVTLGQNPAVIDYSPLYSPTERVLKQQLLKNFD